jgi:hypothetical protein
LHGQTAGRGIVGLGRRVAPWMAIVTFLKYAVGKSGIDKPANTCNLGGFR